MTPRRAPGPSPGVSVILLAAGYGTRLYPLTKDLPKALLPLDGGVVLDAIVNALKTVPQGARTVLVTNHRFVGAFREWQANRRLDIQILDDGTSTPETRCGAIRDLQFGLEPIGPDEDLLVLGTDNLFTWSLGQFVAFGRDHWPSPSVAVRQLASKDEARRCGVVELDAAARIRTFVEKPHEPPSLLGALCVYYFPAPSRGRIQEFVDRGGNVDAPGYFLEWLVTEEATYGMVTQGDWYDIGSVESYQEASRRWAALKPV